MIEKLWEEYNESKAQEARERLIMACLPYVKSSAYRLMIYASPFQDANDLVSAGIIGLMDAIKRYDPDKGASFKNYARYRIRGSIMDEIRYMDWVPYSIRDKARKIEEAMEALENESGKTPDEEDMAAAMGITLGKYHQILLEVSRMTLLLLEDTLYDVGISSVNDGSLSKDPEEELVMSETLKAVGNAIETLPEKEKLVVTLYYYEEMTMKEIGKILGISESRVCQIHSTAILRLNARLKGAIVDIDV